MFSESQYDDLAEALAANTPPAELTKRFSISLTALATVTDSPPIQSRLERLLKLQRLYDEAALREELREALKDLRTLRQNASTPTEHRLTISTLLRLRIPAPILRVSPPNAPTPDPHSPNHSPHPQLNLSHPHPPSASTSSTPPTPTHSCPSNSSSSRRSSPPPPTKPSSSFTTTPTSPSKRAAHPATPSSSVWNPPLCSPTSTTPTNPR